MISRPSTKPLGLRQWAWRHTSMIGTAGVARGYLKRILTCRSATVEAKKLAAKAIQLCEELQDELHTNRVEPDGSLNTFRKD